MFDLIIKNGMLIDGTGADAYQADLAVADGKIAKIGDCSTDEAKQVIDASGKTLTPGFIDPHSHADLSLLVWPKNEAYVLQGVTTQICGNCGLAPAPFHDEVWEAWCWEYTSQNAVNKSVFSPFSFQTDAPAMKAQLKKDYDLDVDWNTLGEYMEKLEQRGFSTNYYPQAGHNHIRNAVMGKAWRPATQEEIEKMKAILRDDFEHGAQGFSTGLDYLPGRFATTDEIEELLKVVKEYGGVYSTHARSFDPADPKGRMNVIYGVREATELCRRTGVKTNISHMIQSFTYGPMENPEMEQALNDATVAELERGWKNEGLPMMYDVLDNPSQGGSTLPHLICLVRSWVLMCGSVEHFLEMIEYPDFVQMIKDQSAEGKGGVFSAAVQDWDMSPLIVTDACKDARFANRSMKQIMKELGTKDLIDAVLTVLKADPYTGMKTCNPGGEGSVRTLLSSERSMPSSDGFAFDLDTQMDLPFPLNRPPHPNNFCYAIRYLLMYGPKRFEDRVRRMTGVPADWFNIHDRGYLKEGFCADIVVIDREHLATNENDMEPGQAPDGIDYVLVNGVITADHKKHTGAMAGKVLRKQR